MLCYDRATGGEKWRSVATEAVPFEPGHTTNTFASSSPVTDGKQIFVSFGSYGIYCFDMDGRPIWKRDLGRMRTRRGFGEASSPALREDTLVIPWDHEDQSFIAALDAKTGEVKWKNRSRRTNRLGNAAHRPTSRSKSGHHEWPTPRAAMTWRPAN